jgi:NAD-dependent SIR2 family protein deacetylase
MSEAIIERMALPLHVRGLEFIEYTLAADMAARPPEVRRSMHQRQTIQRSRVDVERLFASVELLIDRHMQPWSPFVAAWSAGLDSFSAGPALTEHDLRWQLGDFGRSLDARLPRSGTVLAPSPYGTTQLTDSLARGIANWLTKARPTDVSSVLRDIRNEMLQSLFYVLKVANQNKVKYLTPLARLARRQKSLAIATLNYDRTMEMACSMAEVRCETGIETWLKGGQLSWSPTGVRLLKLHGSIDWAPDPAIGPGLPFQRIIKLDPDTEPDHRTRPAVVFGEAGKLRSEGPYLELLLAFSSELKSAETLLIVGYSFRDRHVNELIARWFSADERNRIVVLNPAELQTGEYGSFASAVAQLQVAHEGSLIKPGRVRHIRETTAAGLGTALRAVVSDAPFPVPAET